MPLQKKRKQKVNYIIFILTLLFVSCTRRNINICSSVYYSEHFRLGTEMGVALCIINKTNDTLEIPIQLDLYGEESIDNIGKFKLFKKNSLNQYSEVIKDCPDIHFNVTPEVTKTLIPNDSIKLYVDFYCYRKIELGEYKLNVWLNDNYDLPNLFISHNMILNENGCINCDSIQLKTVKSLR